MKKYGSSGKCRMNQKNIIEQIVQDFPIERLIYEAAHREPIWREKPIGSAIFYSEAIGLTEI